VAIKFKKGRAGGVVPKPLLRRRRLRRTGNNVEIFVEIFIDRECRGRSYQCIRIFR
jgi:hypothetical protein